jgi:hypothetical protein
MAFSPKIAPLTTEEFERATRVWERLCAELRLAIAALPATARSNPRTLARTLAIDLGVCQRVMEAANAPASNVEMLATLPGKAVLRRFVGRLEECARTPQPRLSAAVEQYDALIDDLGGTQTTLAKRLSLPMPKPATQPKKALEPEPGYRHIRQREAAFAAYAQIANAWSDLGFKFGILRLDPADPACMFQLTLSGHLGLQTRGNGFPLAAGVWQVGKNVADKRDGVARDKRSVHLVEEFTTSPLPVSTVRHDIGGSMDMLDVASNSEMDRVDLVLGRWATSIPRPNAADPIWSTVLSVFNPSRRVVLTYYVHRELAEGAKTTGASYFLHPSMSGDPSRHWYEQLPDRPDVQVLGPGYEGAAHPAYARKAEMAEYVFTQFGADPKDYVGYRMDIEFPIWGASYYMTLDYRT